MRKITIKYSEDYTADGETSQKSWESLLSHLEKAFKLRKNEKITGIEVNDDGITARFKFKK